MNFQYASTSNPLKLFFGNPLAPASQLVIVKIMSGVIFGKSQPIDLSLVASLDKKKSVDAFKIEIESCAFSCTNSIKVISEFPSAADGDVFCFMSDFTNPNNLNFNKEGIEDELKILNIIIKMANSFHWADEAKLLELEESKFHTKKNKKSEYLQEHKPILMTDGLIVMDILKSLSNNIPMTLLFCPSPLTTIAKSVLGDHLNVQCNVINDVLVWAANDEVFHVEVEKPLIIHDFHCKSDIIGKDLLKSLNLDSTQFSAAWMKKEFIQKVASSASKNPYGCIYRAAEFSKTLRDIWLTHIQGNATKVRTNMGVISDGSLGTIKGLPYIFPIELSNNSWSVDKRFEEETHLKMEIKRMNKAVNEHHVKLISYCKKFLQENVIYQAFRDEDDSGATSKY